MRCWRRARNSRWGLADCTDRTGAPAKLAVITATGYSYDRPDGIAVLPITSLGP